MGEAFDEGEGFGRDLDRLDRLSRSHGLGGCGWRCFDFWRRGRRRRGSRFGRYGSDGGFCCGVFVGGGWGWCGTATCDQEAESGRSSRDSKIKFHKEGVTDFR